MSTSTMTLFDLVPGKEPLGRYRIVRPHRQNLVAATFEVEDLEHDGERRELQAFPAGLFEDRDQAEDFGRRMLAWRGLRSSIHPALREMHVLDDGTVLVVSNFPSGVSLRAWFTEHGRMPGREVLGLGRRILEGLADVHGAGLVHGDIKPQTIHFDPEGEEVLLVDAGVTTGLWAAKHMGTRTMLIGTPYYAPIEQFSGDPPDVLSDLYNLSTVMYELVTGVLPWSGKSFLEIFQAKMEQQVPRMSQRAPGVEVDRGLEEAILAGISARRQARYQSAEDFLARLELEVE